MQTTDREEEGSCAHDFTMAADYSLISRPESSSGADSLVKTKATFASMWNNIRYEFQSKFRTKFNFDSPIILHGKMYHLKMSDSINYADRKLCALHVFEKFKHDFYSRIWLTYRRDFSALLDTPPSFTSDSGWGCMIRSGQMILAQALVLHLLGRNWRWKGPDSEDCIHRLIITWFGDNPDPSLCPFSIHQFVKLGEKQGRKPGDWFGPASISFILQSALERVAQENEFLKDICCYVAQDCTVYEQDVRDLCKNKNLENGNYGTNWRSVLIMVPVRLGAERFNPLYSHYLKEVLSLPSCCGIIGGQPRHSLYFVGFQDEKLLYLDPHYCQRTVDVTEPNFPLDSYHCLTPRKVKLPSIDPSCAIGFFIKSEQQFNDFLDGTEQLLEQTRQADDYPIFVLSKGKSIQSEPEVMPEKEKDRTFRMNYRLVDSKGNVKKIINTDEFILL